MKRKFRLSAVAVALTGALAAGTAGATNGYFQHGYGLKAKGMAGVGIAFPQDALAAATNPAGMVEVGNRIDFGADLFRPVRSTQIAGAGDFNGNGDSIFLIPEFG